MTVFRLRFLAFLAAAVLLAGCSKPETPQEVAAAFWQAMADNDAGDVVEYSTLTDESRFDGYKHNWTNVVPSFGRVVIDGPKATVVTRLPAEDRPEGERQELITYLVQGPDGWQVDYDRTGEAILNPSPFQGLMGELNRLGDRIARNFSQSSEDFNARMDQLGQDLQTYSEDLRDKAQDAMESFGEKLQDAMKSLEDSLNDALKDNQQAPREDRAVLQQAARDLDTRAEALDEPTAEHLADASRAVAEAGKRIASLSSDTWSEYQQQWESSLEEIRADTREFFENLRQER